jgi:hypothetical protein
MAFLKCIKPMPNLLEERIDHPILKAPVSQNKKMEPIDWKLRSYRQPLSIIGRSRGKQSIEGVVCWNGKANSIDEEFGSNIEEDEEEVQSSKA